MAGALKCLYPIPPFVLENGKSRNWGLNVTRRRRKTEQQYTWNPIDPNVNGFLTQEGFLDRDNQYKASHAPAIFSLFFVYAKSLSGQISRA